MVINFNFVCNHMYYLKIVVYTNVKKIDFISYSLFFILFIFIFIFTFIIIIIIILFCWLLGCDIVCWWFRVVGVGVGGRWLLVGWSWCQGRYAGAEVKALVGIFVIILRLLSIFLIMSGRNLTFLECFLMREY